MKKVLTILCMALLVLGNHAIANDKPEQRSQKMDNGDVSTRNSTLTPLGSAETFTGEWDDISDYGSISVVGKASHSGNLFMEFSIDKTQMDRSIQIPSDTVVVGDFGIHSLVPIAQYFRIRIVNDATPQTSLRVQTLYNVTSRIAQPTSRMVQNLTEHSDVLNTRSVLVGETEAGDFINVPVTPQGKLHVDIPVTAFGELSIAEKTPQVQLQFPYNINSGQVIAFPGNGGTVGNGNAHANMSTGTSSNGFASLLSRDILKYNAGQGAVARFTALFTTGVADSEQVIGCGNGLNGFFFGYDGADFGVLRRSGGKPELRELDVTTGSTTDEDITITLDGIAVTNVTVTNSGDPTITALEIADHSYASGGTGWGARVVGDKVIFISIEPTSKSGSYSLSSATTSVGSFSQVGAGVAPTDTWVNQSNWNVDTMDGEGLSKMDLDHTKGNVYEVSFQWLGYGMITFSIENSVTGKLIPVHQIPYANANTAPSVENPSFPMFAMATNKGNTSNLTIRTSSMSAFSEGKDGGMALFQSVENIFLIGDVETEEPVLTIRNKQVYQGIINQVRLVPTSVTLTSQLATDNEHTVFRIYVFGRPTNGTSYVDVSTNASVVEWDMSAQDFNLDFVTAKLTYTIDGKKSEIINIDNLKIAPASTVLITAQPSKKDSLNVVGVALNWKELF